MSKYPVCSEIESLLQVEEGRSTIEGARHQIQESVASMYELYTQISHNAIKNYTGSNISWFFSEFEVVILTLFNLHADHNYL